MRVDVIFSPSQVAAGQLAGRVVAVIDVLRASTTIAVALANGARAVVPLESSDEVITRGKAFERSDVLMAGERKMVAVPGFDLGNSPLEFTADVVEGKTVLLTTTNGTRALVAAQSARDVIVASYVNFSPALARLRLALEGGHDIVLLCAGREKQFSLEDAACAGRYARHLTRRGDGGVVNDSAQASILIDRRFGNRIDRVFRDAEHGRALADAGFGLDLHECAKIDSYPILPIYQDRQITKIGPDRER